MGTIGPVTGRGPFPPGGLASEPPLLQGFNPATGGVPRRRGGVLPWNKFTPPWRRAINSRQGGVRLYLCCICWRTVNFLPKCSRLHQIASQISKFFRRWHPRTPVPVEGDTPPQIPLCSALYPLYSLAYATATNRHSTADIRLPNSPKSVKSRDIPRKFELIAVQSHPKSSTLVPIENAYASVY